MLGPCVCVWYTKHSTYYPSILLISLQIRRINIKDVEKITFLAGIATHRNWEVRRQAVFIFFFICASARYGALIAETEALHQNIFEAPSSADAMRERIYLCWRGSIKCLFAFYVRTYFSRLRKFTLSSNIKPIELKTILHLKIYVGTLCTRRQHLIQLHFILYKSAFSVPGVPMQHFPMSKLIRFSSDEWEMSRSGANNCSNRTEINK